MPASIAHSLGRPMQSLPIKTLLTFHAVGERPANAAYPVTAIPAPHCWPRTPWRSVPPRFKLRQGGRRVSS